MINSPLLIACLIWGGVAVGLIGFLLSFSERFFVASKGRGSKVVDKGGIAQFGATIFMDLVFYVAIPTFAYASFYVVLPFSGVRAGLATALIATLIGSAPVLMTLSTRTKLPLSFLLYQLLSQMLKAAGGLGVIAYLYHL